MLFDHWTYNQFYMERISWSAEQKAPIHFTVEEIEWAVTQTEYKYFGDYEMSDQQKMATEILVWCARQQLFQKPQEHIYTGTGSDYLDCVLGVAGFESFGPIEKEQTKTVYVDYPPDDCSICPRTNGLHMWGVNHCRHCDQPWPEEYRSKK